MNIKAGHCIWTKYLIKSIDLHCLVLEKFGIKLSDKNRLLVLQQTSMKYGGQGFPFKLILWFQLKLHSF